MKYTIVIISLLLFLFGSRFASAQSLYKVSEDDKIHRSSFIAEGKVISQYSFWNPSHTMIYTTSKVEVYKIFKGNILPEFIEVMTQGGSVGTENITASDLLELSINDIGVVFCNPNTIGLRSPSTGNLLYDVYSSSQGFLKYDPITLTANAPFVRINDVPGDLYSTLEQKTNVTPRIIKNFNIADLRTTANRLEAVSITSFSPAVVNAGATLDPANNLLTINGSGFGTPSGSAAIFFDDANDGTGGTPYSITYNDPLVVSWSATQIQVRVPSRTGTGTFSVRDNAGVSGSSATPLIVNYGILTATFTSGSTVTKESNLMDDNGLGGYTVLYSTNTAGGGVNLNTAPEKATFQRALTTLKEGVGYNVIEGGTTTIQAVTGDGFNVVMFDNNNTGNPVLAAGVLAVCYSYNSMCTPITANQVQKTEFDIVIRNTGVSAGSTNFTSGPCPPASSDYHNIDLETVLLHELGHSLNLAHINDSYQGSFVPNLNPGKLMNFAVVNSVKRTSLDYSAYQGALYAINAQGNTYGVCGLSSVEMAPLAPTIESKDDCPLVFPSTSIPNNTSVAFDLTHATSNKYVDPQYNSLNCSGSGTGVTNTAFYAFKTVGSGGGTLLLTVSGYSTTPPSLASCTPVSPYAAAAGVEISIYAVSTCPAGQAFPAPIACRTFNANGTITAITGLSNNTTYLLVADGIENTKANFSLTFGGSVLPLSLSSFSGKIIGEANRISWVAELATDVNEVILERSNDGIHFSTIHRIDGNNIERNGLYNDTRPFAGNNYYRLRINNADGSNTYSSTVLLIRKEKFIITAYPNPVENNLSLEINTGSSNKLVFELYNSTGQLVTRQENMINPGKQIITLRTSNPLPGGNYFVRITDKTRVLIKTVPLVIQ